MQQPDYSISTPENVDLHLEIAGLGNRLLAQLVDGLISIGVALLIIIVALALALIINAMPMGSQSKSIWYAILGMFSIFVIFLLINCYFIFFEGLWQGQTPGKRVAEIRVIEANGQPIGWVGAFIRNLLRMVDNIMLIGLVIMLFDKNERRLGDMAAGTIVIRERKTDISTTQLALTSTPGANLLDIGRVTPAEYDLVVDFLKRRVSLAKSHRPLVAQKLAKYFQEKLSAPVDTGVAPAADPENYLEQIYHSYQARAND